MSQDMNRVLLLTFARQGEEAAIEAAIGALRSEAPGAEVMAIGTAASAPVLRDLGVTEVIVYGEGQGARQVVKEVRARAPRAAGVVYGGPEFSGHLKLELLALCSGAKRIHQFPGEGTARTAGRLRLLGSVCAKALRAGACLAASALMCGAALCWLRLMQAAAGGHRAGGA